MTAILASHSQVYAPKRETATFFHEDMNVIRFRLTTLSEDFERSGKRMLVEKTPYHLYRIELIRKIVEKPRFIVMVRDGRDVVASLLRRFNDVARGIKIWGAAAFTTLRHKDDDDVLLVRYEDLVSNTDATIHVIIDFLDLEFESALLRHHEMQQTWFGIQAEEPGTGKDGEEHIKLRSWQVNQPIFDGRGRYKKIMTEDQMTAFSDPTFIHLMRRLNYDPAP